MTTDILAPARHVIGTPYTDSVKPYILTLTGLHIAVGPKDFSTRDLRSDRIFISVDESNFITDLNIA